MTPPILELVVRQIKSLNHLSLERSSASDVMAQAHSKYLEKKISWETPSMILRFNTDEFGEENGFTLSANPEDGSSPKILGSLKSESKYVKQVCAFEGTYTLTIFRKCSYSAHIAGEEVLFGLNFRLKLSSHTLAGCVCVCLGLRLRGTFPIYESIETTGQGVPRRPHGL